MKKGILLTCIICLVILTQVDAKIWRVNNTTGADADFTTLQAAHDGASAGDTLMLEPSVTSYGNLAAVKKVIIIGPGYLFSENYPNYPIVNSAKVGIITFDIGSSDSQLIGVEISTGTSNSIVINVSGIVITRNFSASAVVGGNSVSVSSGVSNVYFTQNYNIGISSLGNATNLIVANNYSRYVYLGSNTIAVVVNNLFAPSATTLILQNQTVSNCILVTSGNITFTNCTFSNNIDASSAVSFRFGTTNGNVGGFTTSQVFVGASGNSTDGQWKLKTGSPAIGAGTSGEDCGMFGGATPYILSGLPPIPLFTNIVQSSVGSNTTPIKVTVSIDSKN